ncbi:MAG: hypothetical protein PUG66_06485 [Clostridiales bacterium]|nr:hypothetical protein [Clostridiales bacterium]
MAKNKKEKQPFFTKAEFDGCESAVLMKGSAQSKLDKCKIGLLIAAGAELFYVLSGVFGSIHLLSDIFSWIGIVATVASYVIGGGILIGLKAAWKISTTIGWVGWFCVPFPADIPLGIMLTVIGLCIFPFMLIFLPIALVFCGYIQAKKDYNAAEEYISMYQKTNN